jgi:hypothetical protein
MGKRYNHIYEHLGPNKKLATKIKNSPSGGLPTRQKGHRSRKRIPKDPKKSNITKKVKYI